MSHKKLRTEKKCLNCGHSVEERFCSHCGQENLELHDSALQLVLHYIQDAFSYDSRFWHTLGGLFVRPGKVSREYMSGMRRQNLEPIRFYVFTSSVFFLIFFFKINSNTWNISDKNANRFSKRLYHLKQEKEYTKGTQDTIFVNKLTEAIHQKMKEDANAGKDSSAPELEIDLFDIPVETAQAKGWLGKLILKRAESRTKEMEKEYEGDEVSATTAFINEVIHALPQLFFLSLPFFALFLKLLYWRRPGNTYVEHFIFSIYHYAYMFVIMSGYFFLDWLTDKVDVASFQSLSGGVITALVIYPFAYLFLSMKRFYNDRWGRLILRYFTLLFLTLIAIIVLFLVLATITFLF